MANYSAIRGNIRSGDILAWTHRKWGSFYDIQIQAVRVFTESEYSHVGVAWVIGGRVFVIEAVTPKVRIFPLSKLLPFYKIAINRPWTQEAEEFALAQVGCEYSKLQAIGAFFGYVNNDNLWECAELTAAISKLNGLNLGLKFTPSEVVNQALLQCDSLQLVEPD